MLRKQMRYVSFDEETPSSSSNATPQPSENLSNTISTTSHGGVEEVAGAKEGTTVEEGTSSTRKRLAVEEGTTSTRKRLVQNGHLVCVSVLMTWVAAAGALAWIAAEESWQRSTMPTLPILRPTNVSRMEHPEWHAYVETVYGHEVNCDVDLNTFQWFYNFAPLFLYNVVPYKKPLHSTDTPKDTIYFAGYPLNVEHIFAQYGWFVNRGNVQWDADERVEVLRVACAAEEEGAYDAFDTLPFTNHTTPSNASRVFFFGLRGTGIFVSRTSLHPWMMSMTLTRPELYAETTHARTVYDPCTADLVYTTGWGGKTSCTCATRPPGMISCGNKPVAVRRYGATGC